MSLKFKTIQTLLLNHIKQLTYNSIPNPKHHTTIPRTNPPLVMSEKWLVVSESDVVMTYADHKKISVFGITPENASRERVSRPGKTGLFGIAEGSVLRFSSAQEMRFTNLERFFIFYFSWIIFSGRETKPPGQFGLKFLWDFFVVVFQDFFHNF